MSEKFRKLCLETAQGSPCAKRKVGAIVVGNGHVVGAGWNYNTAGGSCEKDGVTVGTVIHAEVNAMNAALTYVSNEGVWTTLKGCTIYVTHPPCESCKSAIQKAGIEDIVIVEDFLKFDTDKLRYDLVPPETIEALAKVLTYGAKKYKPDNWKSCSDVGRYTAALMRHLEAYRKGEILDKESGMPHLYHVLTNVAFLAWFEDQK